MGRRAEDADSSAALKEKFGSSPPDARCAAHDEGNLPGKLALHGVPFLPSAGFIRPFALPDISLFRSIQADKAKFLL
jgi:hypothetical protein